MPNTATVTAKLGPGLTATAIVLSPVNGIDFQFDRKVVGIRHGDPEKTSYFEYADIATVTFTVSQPDTAVVIST